MSGPRTIIASNRLPVNIVQGNGGLRVHRSVGGLATALGPVFERGNALWIGWTGHKGVLSKKQLAALDFPERLMPVAITEKLLRGYYDRVANGVLWPVMHGLQPAH